MDPNYEDFNDFHGEVECRFAELVFNYIRMEWEVCISQYSPDVMGKALALIETMKHSSNIPNIAGKIAMEVLPL